MSDLRNSRARLKTLLKRVQYPHLHAASLESASVKELLRILHFALLDYSRAVAAFIQSKGYDLYGKTDLRFVDSAFHLLRDEFKYFPSLNSTQFLSEHYWERKLNLVSDILQLVLAKHGESAWLKRQQDAVWTKPRASKGAPTRIENHILPAPPSREKVPSHAVTVLQLLRHAQNKLRERRLEEAEDTATRAFGDSRRDPGGADNQSPERQSNGRRAEGTWNASTPQEDQNGAMHGHKKRVTFDPENNNDLEEDRTDHFCDSGYEATVDNKNDSKTTSTNTATNHIERVRPASSSTADLAESLAALSSQIAGLSSVFMTKISSVEDRLSRLESEMRTLSTTSNQNHQQTTRKTPLADVSNGDDDKENQIENQWAPQTRGSSRHSQASEAASRLRFQIESCSWPPKPSVFARP